MLELAPRPVAASFPLAAAFARAPRDHPLGVWLRGRRPVAVVVVRGRERRALLIDHDLGRLLRRCSSIAVRRGADIVVVSADALMRVRALRVGVGLLYPASVATLRALFPDAPDALAVVEVPLGQRTAEEVLAACATARTPILFSRVVYRQLGAGAGAEPGAPNGGHRAVDSGPGQPLG